MQFMLLVVVAVGISTFLGVRYESRVRSYRRNPEHAFDRHRVVVTISAPGSPDGEPETWRIDADVELKPKGGTSPEIRSLAVLEQPP